MTPKTPWSAAGRKPVSIIWEEWPWAVIRVQEAQRGRFSPCVGEELGRGGGEGRAGGHWTNGQGRTSQEDKIWGHRRAAPALCTVANFRWIVNLRRTFAVRLRTGRTQTLWDAQARLWGQAHNTWFQSRHTLAFQDTIFPLVKWNLWEEFITPCSNPSFLFTIMTIIGDLVGQTKNRGASFFKWQSSVECKSQNGACSRSRVGASAQQRVTTCWKSRGRRQEGQRGHVRAGSWAGEQGPHGDRRAPGTCWTRWSQLSLDACNVPGKCWELCLNYSWCFQEDPTPKRLVSQTVYWLRVSH